MKSLQVNVFHLPNSWQPPSLTSFTTLTSCFDPYLTTREIWSGSRLYPASLEPSLVTPIIYLNINLIRTLWRHYLVRAA
jgi:hypothetical protein